MFSFLFIRAWIEEIWWFKNESSIVFSMHLKKWIRRPWPTSSEAHTHSTNPLSLKSRSSWFGLRNSASAVHGPNLWAFLEEIPLTKIKRITMLLQRKSLGRVFQTAVPQTENLPKPARAVHEMVRQDNFALSHWVVSSLFVEKVS